MKNSKNNQVSVKDTLALFWRFTARYKVLFWYATIGSIVSALVSDILPPLVIASAFNKLQSLYAHHLPITFAALEPYFIGYVAVNLAAMVLWRTQAYAAWKYSIMVEKDMMDHIFNHLQHMDSTFHANRFGGALVSQTNKFVNAYDGFMSNFNWNILNGVTAYIASLIVLFVANPIYAAIFLGISIVYVIVIGKQMRKQMPYNRALSQSESRTTAKLADTITNVATVRSFAGEKIESRIFDKQTTETRTRNLDLMKVQLTNELMSQTGQTVVQIVAFGVGILSIVKFHTPVGAFYLTLSYTLALSERLWNFMFILRNLNRQFGDAADMTMILGMSTRVKDPEKPERIRMQRGGVAFNNVTFAYPENANRALFKNLSLRIKPGEKVGLVGPSGGGKTTITQLLLRSMDIQDGDISIDGQNIASVRQRDLRSRIAYVSQEPILFHRTLADNIAYGNQSASRKVIQGVAKMAHAHDFITGLSEGYDTLVGERGVKLSGGQRQRVAIARAMLKNTPILVLDEATSALDSESEVLIQDALWKLMEGKTAIVIAHRLSTIQKMDRIIVLDKGKVVEEGSHKELLKLGGTYAKLWSHQSGGFIEE